MRVVGIDPQRRAGEAGVAERADREQLAAVRRVRRVDVPAEAAHVALRGRRRRRSSSCATVSGDRMRVPSSVPPFSSMRQKSERSAAVLKSPACPATPPMRRAVGSCTTPRSIGGSGPSHGQPSGVHFSVGAMRGRNDRGRQEHRVVHAERLEDPRPRELVRAAAAHAADDVAEQEEVDVAVDEALARRLDVGTSSIASSIAASEPLHVVAPGRDRAAGPTCASSGGGW